MADQKPSIAVGTDGTVWYTNEQGELWRRTPTGWEQPNLTDRATHVAVGSADVVWCINSSGQVFQRQGNKWIEPDKNARLAQLSVADPNNIWGLNAAGDIYQLVGASWKAVDRPTHPTPSTTYKVKTGDTLYSIAKHYKTTVQQMMALNPIITDPNKIKVGWDLKVPAK